MALIDWIEGLMARHLLWLAWLYFLDMIVFSVAATAAIVYPRWREGQRAPQTQPEQPPPPEASSKEVAVVQRIEVDEPVVDEPVAVSREDLEAINASIREFAQALEKSSTDAALKTANVETTLRSELDEKFAQALEKSSTDAALKTANVETTLRSELHKKFAQSDSFKKLSDKLTQLTSDVATIRQNAEKNEGLLAEERRWFQETLRLVQPKQASDLYLIKGGFTKPSGTYWADLHKKWQVLRNNEVYRKKLLSLWNCEPMLQVGDHFQKLLKTSTRLAPEVQLAARKAPPRLEYWRRLHRSARRQYLGLSNFFARLTHLGEPDLKTFDSAILGMTLAEYEIGWRCVVEPSAGTATLTQTDIDGFAEKAREKLLEAWLTPVLQLYHELYEIPHYEWPSDAGKPDDLAYAQGAEGDGAVGIMDDVIHSAAHALEYDYIAIAPYSPVSYEVASVVNVDAITYRQFDEWLGYPRSIGEPRILRLRRPAFKPRRPNAAFLGGGADVIVGRSSHE